MRLYGQGAKAHKQEQADDIALQDAINDLLESEEL